MTEPLTDAELANGLIAMAEGSLRDDERGQWVASRRLAALPKPPADVTKLVGRLRLAERDTVYAMYNILNAYPPPFFTEAGA